MCARKFSLALLVMCCWTSCHATVNILPTLPDVQTESEDFFNNLFKLPSIVPVLSSTPAPVNCEATVTRDAVWQNPDYPEAEEGLPAICTLKLTPPAGTCGIKINFDDLAINNGFSLANAAACEPSSPSFKMSFDGGITRSLCADLTGFEGVLQTEANDTDSKILLLQMDPKVAFKFRINVTVVPCNSITEFQSPSICGIKNDATVPLGRSDISPYDVDEDDTLDTVRSKRHSIRSGQISSKKERIQLRRKEMAESLRKENNFFSQGLAQAVEEGKVKLAPKQKSFSAQSEEAGIGEWPWMVAIERTFVFDFELPFSSSPNQAQSLPQCSGVLVDNKHVLTTAFCVNLGIPIQSIKVTGVRALLGEHDLSLDNETLTFNASVSKVTFPFSYDPFLFKDDAVILTLEEPVNYTRNIRPICLPVDYNVYKDDKAFTMGWPASEFIPPSMLMSTELRLTNQTFCNETISSFLSWLILAGLDVSKIDTNNFICAVEPRDDTVDILPYCDNAIGAPLVRKDQTGAYFLEGLSTTIQTCGLFSIPSVFTSVVPLSGFLNLALA